MKKTATNILAISILFVFASSPLFAQTSKKITLTEGITSTSFSVPASGTSLFNIDLRKEQSPCFRVLTASSIEVTFDGKPVTVNPKKLDDCMGRVGPNGGNFEIKVVNKTSKKASVDMTIRIE